MSEGLRIWTNTAAALSLDELVIGTMYSNTFGRWNKFSQIIWFILHLIGYCCAIDYEFRIDLLPPCADNSKNIARLEYLDFAKMTHNRFSTNGTLVVDAVLKDPFRVIVTHESVRI